MGSCWGKFEGAVGLFSGRFVGGPLRPNRPGTFYGALDGQVRPFWRSVCLSEWGVACVWSGEWGVVRVSARAPLWDFGAAPPLVCVPPRPLAAPPRGARFLGGGGGGLVVACVYIRRPLLWRVASGCGFGDCSLLLGFLTLLVLLFGVCCLRYSVRCCLVVVV